MRQVTLYNKTTGELGPQVFNSDAAIVAMCGDKWAAKDGAWNQEDYYVDPLTKNAIQRYPDLPLLKQRAWYDIKNQRDKLMYGTFATPLGVVQINEGSRLKINAAALAAVTTGPLFSVQWKMADNCLVTFNAKAMIDLQAQIVAYDAQLTLTASGLENQIAEAINGKAVAAIVWPAALPSQGQGAKGTA